MLRFLLLLSFCFSFFVNAFALEEPELPESLEFSGIETSEEVYDPFYQGHRLWGNKKKYGAFISYKRCDGKHLASLIQARLKLQNVKAFLDVRDLCNGAFDTALFESINKSKSFILVLTTRAMADLTNYVYGHESFVYKELKYAIENRKNIIPIFDEQVYFPQRSIKLLKGIRKVVRCNGIEWNHKHQEDNIKTLIKFIKRGGSCIEEEEDNN